MQFKASADDARHRNTASSWRFVIISALSVQIIVGLAALCFGEDDTLTGTKRTVALANQRWQSIFGEVDFSDSLLFERMIYLHPRLEDQFLAFQGEILSKGLEMNHSGWVRRFFKGDLLENVVDLAPAGYFLNESRVEPSLLLYKTDFLQSEISIQESFNVVFLTIRREGFEQEEGITAADARDILVRWTNIGDSEIMNFVGDYEFRDVMNVGHVFSNSQGRRIQRITDWRSDVVGFISDRGISFLFFKVDPDTPRAELGLSYDFDWLNKGLLEADGRTLVDRSYSLDELKSSERKK